MPFQLPDTKTQLEAVHPESGEKVDVTITFKNAKTAGDREVVQFFNILMNRILRILKFTQHLRNFYDARSAKHIKQYNLQIWPGYVTAIDFFEGDRGLMTSHLRRL